MIIALDNGLDGAICAIAETDGSVINYTALPTIDRKDKREIDIVATREWIRDLNPQPDSQFVVEEPLHFAKTLASMRSMGISFGTLCGLIRLLGYEPYCMEVKEWQKPVLGRIKRGHSKVEALKLVRQIEPDETWLKNDRCRTPHDGIVDAFLLARYYRHLFYRPEPFLLASKRIVRDK